jgi:hypothetical protein
MSTSGIVAVGTLPEWRGIYSNSNSNPTYLGRNLREGFIEEIAGGKSLREISETILSFDDWDNYQNGGVCPYCGKIATQPHSMTSDLVIGAGTFDECPDPDCLRHKHEPMADLLKVQYTSNSIEDDSDIEWIYVINVKARLIHVIDNRKDYGRNLHVGDIPLRGAEPNYEHLQCAADYSRCSCLARAHFPEIFGSSGERLVTKQYLGMEPVGKMEDAVAVILKSERHDWNGKAFTKDGFMFSSPRPKLDTCIPNALHAELEINDEKEWIPVGVLDGEMKRPAPGVVWVFPATKVMPEFAVIGK